MKSSTTRAAILRWKQLARPSSSHLLSLDGCRLLSAAGGGVTKNDNGNTLGRRMAGHGDRPFSTAVREEAGEVEEGLGGNSLPQFRPNGEIRRPPNDEQRQQQQRPTNEKKLQQQQDLSGAVNPGPCTCGLAQKEIQKESQTPLPPPLPAPVYSVHKRVLPEKLTALSSPQGRKYLLESMFHQTSESYWSLTEHFVNQSDPAFCGVTTLLMVLNAMNMDPNVRWKGGWRYYGDENVLLQRCCLNTERIRRVGITMEQFMVLGTCHGMDITMKRPAVANNDTGKLPPLSAPHYTLEEFRKDIKQTLDSAHNKESAVLVSSFSRSALGQTGDGHFSPIAAYHEEADQVLILDVARFKYTPYWVNVEDLFTSMEPLDEATQMPRGWYIMKPPLTAISSWELNSEDRRPAHLVPTANETDNCPIGQIKVQYCPATKPHKTDENDNDKFPKELM